MRPARSVEGNARLTGLTSSVLFLLFMAEGVTVLRVHELLTPHVVIGMVMIPVVIVKMGSTLWRFARYYTGDPEYRRKGPPPVFLRLLGPFVVVLTVAVLGTGIALLFVPTADRSGWLFLHKATFVLWLGAMALHVLAHLLETANLTWNDLSRPHGARSWRGRARMAARVGAGTRYPPRDPRHTSRQWMAPGARWRERWLAQHDRAGASRRNAPLTGSCSQTFPRAGGRGIPRSGALVGVLALVLVLASCSTAPSARGAASGSRSRRTASTTSTTTTVPPTTTTTAPPAPTPLAAPATLTPFAPPATPTDGTWTPAGRPVNGAPAVYETRLVPPGGTAAAGIAWMDTNLFSAQLYSGSKSPGGGPYQFTAPVAPAQAATLVAAFNGGFLMKDAEGGYFTEGRTVYPLVVGAASLVIRSDGSVNVGAWGSDVTMTPDVVAVRQNLVPLVEAGQPTAQAANPDWNVWGATCGVSSCSGPGSRTSGAPRVGVTANGALVYVAGPALNPLQLAQLLVRAGVVRGMELDINPSWPVFATYDPPRRRPGRAVERDRAWRRAASRARPPSSRPPGPGTS